ncbi:MAG: hypothetical protein CSA97_00490, partial [Bacteroidetes bacterium]
MVTFGLLLAISLIAGTFFAVRSAHYTIKKQTVEEMQAKAKLASQVVDLRIRGLFSVIEGMANMPYLREDSLSFAEKVELLYGMYQSDEFVYISLGDPLGNGYLHGGQTFSAREQVWWQKAMEGKEYAVEPFEDVL